MMLVLGIGCGFFIPILLIEMDGLVICTLAADILKVIHHGSITSITESVLKLIDLKFAVIFVGKGNKFRHPSPIVMERLGRLGI